MGNVRQLEYYSISQEAAWSDGGSSFTGIAFDEYGVEPENTVSPQDKMTGVDDAQFVDITGQTLSGSVTSQVWPDNATLLMALGGLPRVSELVPSFTAKMYDRAKNEYLIHYGLMCDTLKISCSGSDPKLKFQYDLIGRDEQTVGSFAKASLPAQAAWEFSDAAFTIAGATENNVIGFEITIKNNLKPADARDTSRRVKWIDTGRREIEVQFTVRTDSTLGAHYRNLVRSRNTGIAFVVTFNYPGSGSPLDTLAFNIPTLVLSKAERQGAVADIQSIQVTGTAKKPSASQAIIVSTS